MTEIHGAFARIVVASGDQAEKGSESARVDDRRARGRHAPFLSPPQSGGEGGPARRAFPTAQAQGTGGAPGRSFPATATFPRSAPKSQDLTGHRRIHAGKRSFHASSSVHHHFTATPPPCQPDFPQANHPSIHPSPSRATSAAVLAFFSLLSLAAGSASSGILGAHASTPHRPRERGGSGSAVLSIKWARTAQAAASLSRRARAPHLSSDSARRSPR